MKKLSAIFIVFISLSAFAQTGGVGINANGTPPDPSAILDLSTANKGFLLPRLSQSQRNAIGNPALGLMIYDTSDNCIEVYGFGNWQTVSCLCSGAPPTPSVITGNNSPCANANSVTYSVALVLGANTYTWTVPADAVIIAGQGTNSITVNFGANPGNVSVTANNSCGSSSPLSLPVTIDSITSLPGIITGNPYPCANSTAQAYSVTAVNGATSYTWSAPSGAVIGSGQGTNTILVNFATTPGNIAVTANNTCGSSGASILPIAMAITPSTPGSITGPANFTTNQSGLVYSITPVTEATTYAWTLPANGTITSGQGTDSITVSPGNNGQICVTAGNCAGTSAGSCLDIINSCYAPGSQTFSYTGASQTFTVPCGVDSISISVWGAAGGIGNQGGSIGGLGGYATGTLSVTAGQVFQVNVGGMPQNSSTGGWNGGGNGGSGGSGYAGGGGGGTDIRPMANTSLNGRIIVAGGGGGNSNGGYGGGTEGCAYGNTVGQNTSNGSGGGGTQNAGGAAGLGVAASWPSCATNGNAGSFGTGGNGVYNYYTYTCGVYITGGGGGGWYGGGSGGTSGDFGGGPSAGGSGYIGGIANGTMQTGIQSGSGQVVISW